MTESSEIIIRQLLDEIVVRVRFTDRDGLANSGAHLDAIERLAMAARKTLDGETASLPLEGY